MAAILSEKVKRIHCIGIGGIGMSGLGLLLAEKGYQVSGSDMKESKLCGYLRKKNIPVTIGHAARLVRGQDLICVSSAIHSDNPELVKARRDGIPIVKRGVLLAELLRDKRVIAVSGSHGKTTTTALIAFLLKELGIDCASFIGGVSRNYPAHAWWGKSSLFVIETDESDGTFLEYTPEYAVITNIDHEHLDFYRTKERLDRAFSKFASQTSRKVIFWGDDSKLCSLVNNVSAEKSSYGFRASNDYSAQNIRLSPFHSSFDIFQKKKKITHLTTPLPGRHNILNTLAAFAVVSDWASPKAIKQHLCSFRSTSRRFEVQYQNKNFILLDDYAHHPSEIESTLSAARGLGYKRVIALFQPHRYTRLKKLAARFSGCFSAADLVLVTDVYSAQEKPIPGINGPFIHRRIQNFHHHVFYLSRERLAEKLVQFIRPGDCIVALGAGDIGRLSQEILIPYLEKLHA